MKTVDCWSNVGVLEYWSVAMMVSGFMPFPQYAITSKLQDREFQETSGNLKINSLFIYEEQRNSHEIGFEDEPIRGCVTV